MKKMLLPVLAVCATGVAIAQPGGRGAAPDTLWKKVYQATAPKVFDLVHTKLDVSFDYAQRRMPGKAWLTLKPHAYPQDSLILDAKGMLVNKVALLQGSVFKPLAFSYPDTLQLRIALDKTYQPGENLTVYIDYVARPDEMRFKGSQAITNAKGLYFINPDGKDTTKPTQIWTQGETEANSVWMPTIDKPNQKTTEEIYMTVPAKYVTLSNGLLKSSVLNKNGTRTDYWKMDLPHSPYLFFMGVGDFAVVKDKYKNLAVDYYVEPKYAAVARKLFGLTPEMIGFYSKLLGVEFPWPKYAQMVGRDYVSGAMENTTATLHGSGIYRSSRELADGNPWESTVAHELFHQWFGDLVTAESWSNLTVNESFADYSELLWQEYKYGKDDATALNYTNAQGYLSSRPSASRDLVRFRYADKEDMFDGVSYTKGGRILHMLRTYLGDSVFFKGLNIYLTTNRFKSGEAQQLRLALEEASGRDLNWFFNQWYYGAGHPVVSIAYNWSDSAKMEQVTITQHQTNLFTFPLNMEVYNGGQKMAQTVWMSNADSVSTFYLNTGGTQPSYVNVDREKVMLWRKDDQKPKDWWLAQYDHANNYVDKIETLNWLAANFDSSDAQKAIYTRALSDGYYGVRSQAIGFYNRNPQWLTAAEEAVLYSMAQQYRHQPTRAAAIGLLSKKYGNKYAALYRSAVSDSSYTVAGAALEGLITSDMAAAKALQPQLSKDAKGRLLSSLNIITYSSKTDADADSVLATFRRANFSEKIGLVKPVAYYLANAKEVATFKKVAGTVLEFGGNRMVGMMGAGTGNPIKALMTDSFTWLVQQKENALAANPGNAALQEQIKYVKDKMAAMQ